MPFEKEINTVIYRKGINFSQNYTEVHGMGKAEPVKLQRNDDAYMAAYLAGDSFYYALPLNSHADSAFFILVRAGNIRDTVGVRYKRRFYVEDGKYTYWPDSLAILYLSGAFLPDSCSLRQYQFSDWYENAVSLRLTLKP